MKYVSTRGNSSSLEFEDIVCAGLADDNGLYVPEELPHFSKDEISSMKGMSYQDLAFTIIKPFVAGSISDKDLSKIIEKSYSTFTDEEIAPLTKIHNNEYILELYHGPTLAFKDFALQILGNLIEHVLEKKKETVTIIGATSGDTGSAAIKGCMHCKNVKMFILHPNNRISDVQRKQMTTVISDNVFNIAVESHFDFCQDIVKKLFNDQSFLENKTKLIAINSINWCRIMAQIVYYFYAAVKLGSPEEEISFSVPTGNFGDIFAGFIANKMGLPIKQLIIATNQNDILDRFIKSNNYSKGTLIKTLSPSMDIQVASNFERLLYYIHDCDGLKVKKFMEEFETGPITLEKDKYNEIKALFSSHSVNDKDTCKTIKRIFNKTSIIIDPHTATGIKAAEKCNKDIKTPMVILSTAHPAKFPDAIEAAEVPHAPYPEQLLEIINKEEKYTILQEDIFEIKEFVKWNL